VLAATLFGACDLPLRRWTLAKRPRRHGPSGTLRPRLGFGKLIILVLLGFAATDFVVNARSLPDAAEHLVHNRRPGFKTARLVEQAINRLPIGFPTAGWRIIQYWNRQVSLPGLSILSFAFWHFPQRLHKGRGSVFRLSWPCSTWPSIFRADCGIELPGARPELIEHWWATVTQPAGVLRRSPGSPRCLAATGPPEPAAFPTARVGLSGFE